MGFALSTLGCMPCTWLMRSVLSRALAPGSGSDAALSRALWCDSEVLDGDAERGAGSDAWRARQTSLMRLSSKSRQMGMM